VILVAARLLPLLGRPRLLGEGTDCSRPTKAINIGDGLFQLDALKLYVAMTRGSKLLVLCSKTMLLNPRRK
jgi:hypothetical protein